MLVLDEVRSHLLLSSSQILDHLCDFDTANNGVCACDCWNDVAGHVLDLIKGLLLNAEAVHTQIGCTTYEVNDVIVVFLEYYGSVLLLGSQKAFKGLYQSAN